MVGYVAMVKGAEAGGVIATARLRVPFDLAIGESVEVEGSGIVVEFLNVTEDSRCPSDVVCIWAGQVSVMVGLSQASGADIDSFVLTTGAGSDPGAAERLVGNYMVRLENVEPYPASSHAIEQSEYVATLALSDAGDTLTYRAVLVKALGSNGTQSPSIFRFIAGWSIEREIGLAVFALADNETTSLSRVVAKFLPFAADCTRPEMAECVDGQITLISGNVTLREGDIIHMEVIEDHTKMYVSFRAPMSGGAPNGITGGEYALDVRSLKEVIKPFTPDDNATIVILREGERDGPLMVQEIFPDRVEGLNFYEYPIATGEGVPITLHVGERSSNGCTVFLTLLKINEESAVFQKQIVEDRPCPICWYQLALVSR